MESTITYDLEATLSAPPGDILKSIRVRITIEPSDAGALVYGYTDPTTLTAIQVPGGIREVDLPFIRPEILIKYLGGLTSFSAETLGYREVI
jgi:hypothetical protein